MPSSLSREIPGRIEISPSLADRIRTSVQNLAQLREELEGTGKNNVTDFLHTMLIASLPLDASDLHMEPEGETAKIRLRIDGLLHDLITLSRPSYEALLSRIKLTARMKLNISDKPQDGRFSFSAKEDIIEARVSALPSEYGESVVLRILNPKNFITLDELGLHQEALRVLVKELKKPNGLVVATGPTGSGKTTTLYAFLKEIIRPEIKIITIEDPIEYHLRGISQTQVHPEKGYDFASGLQAIVRQDPDIILVGEIRDKATAQISLQAALTGHLVFSTLHANDAPGTISRFISLGAEPANVGSASNIIIGQRLIRKVCPHCTAFTKATSAELTHLKKELQGVKDAGISALSANLKLARPKGCKECNATGYKGRTGIFEVMLVDDRMEDFILKKSSASALRKFAIEQGMIPMYKDGLLKVILGTTNLQELERVMGEEET